MIDNLDPAERPADVPARRGAPAARPMADREVPIGGHSAPSIHAWLDGEISESSVRRGDAVRDVDFWLRIEREVEVRREMKTPAHVYQQIMESLPMAAPRATPWWRRTLTVSPMLAAAAAVTAVAVGVVIGAVFLSSR
ncbi:MAG TPA: hypothetical protein VIQ74_04590 [Gemmatimonadaceae bacterium]